MTKQLLSGQVTLLVWQLVKNIQLNLGYLAFQDLVVQLKQESTAQISILAKSMMFKQVCGTLRLQVQKVV